MKPTDRSGLSRDDSSSSKSSRKSSSSTTRPTLVASPPVELLRANVPMRLPPNLALHVQNSRRAKEVGQSDVRSASAAEEQGRKSSTSGVLRQDVSDGMALSGRRIISTPAMAASPALQRLKSRSSIGASSPEPATSPSLEAAFASPLTAGVPTASTTSSSESIESAESVKTLKGTSTVVPGFDSLRTPSYPFPRMLSTASSSGNWSSPLHQPFTALSPTDFTPSRHNIGATFRPSQVTSASESDLLNERASSASLGSGVEATSPDLYSIVLRLSSEPSLNSWWLNLTDILHESYSVSRASLSIPVDPTDIQNVPWGQKASFDAAGLKRHGSSLNSVQRSSSSSSRYSKASSSSKSAKSETPQQKMVRLSQQVRPSLDTRHSYAGHEGGGLRGGHSSGLRRPQMSRTNTNYDPENTRDTTDSIDRLIRESNPLLSVAFPPQLVTDESSSHESCSALFIKLHSLSRELDPLIDASGINHVMERSKLVVLTREYTHTAKDGGKANWSTSASGSFQQTHESLNNYEEYEQFPPSPWVQSPAPSPAIQNDVEENPFFVDEASFNPASQAQDYAQIDSVEAIGIDKASTVIHIPLIHPTLSKNMQAAAEAPQEQTRQKSRRGKSVKSRETGQQPEVRKTPIAILSLFSRSTPYPRELVRSLRLLSPHLATTLHSSQMASSPQEQANRALLHSDRIADIAASLGQPLSVIVEKLLAYDNEDTTSSTAGSIISPSEYSGRSRRSPISSVASTPRAEIGIHGYHVSNPSTPRTSENKDSDSYFETMKRMPLSRSQSTHVVPEKLSALHPPILTRTHQTTDQRPLRRLDSVDKLPEDMQELSRADRRDRQEKERRAKTYNSFGEATPWDSGEHLLSTDQGQGSHTTEDDPNPTKRHAVLHSYGADFKASFETMPVTAMPRLGVLHPSHGRSSSVSDVFDMPPPSERLLRTIIDSLPVQIFTAAPGSGTITWVNSRRLAYSGKTPRQLLEDPWECIHPDDMEDYLCAWNQSLRTGQQFQHKLRLRRFDGSFRWYFARAAPLRAKSGVIVHWSGTFTDFHGKFRQLSFHSMAPNCTRHISCRTHGSEATGNHNFRSEI